jgi:hypothetical protein
MPRFIGAFLFYLNSFISNPKVIVRLSLLAITSLVLLLLSAVFHNSTSDGPNVSFLFFVVSLAAIAYTIWSDAEFNIAGNFLILTKPSRQQKFDLKQLHRWEEISYPIRGQRRRKLVLVFDHRRTVELSNTNHKEKYEMVYCHLKREYPLIEKFNMTVMQEIKFGSFHRFLTTEFYPTVDKYHRPDEVKTKACSIEVFKMKIEGAERDRIAKKLFEIKTKILGGSETVNRCLQIADRVIDF